ncbi:MAG: thermonuclease family protein [Siculibacillus sp.]|nr:thermonuclease family protein [Siculibacillus sp.]
MSPSHFPFRSPIAPFRGRLGLFLLLTAAALAWKAWPVVAPFVVPADRFSGRIHVTDGDSLELDGVRIRLLGIDAPELSQTCSLAGMDHPCGREAREHLVHLIAGRPVVCTSVETDRYGRHLGRCRAGDTDLSAAMVESGWAVAYGGHERQEAVARAHGRGLWSGDFVWPEDFRRRARDRREAGWFERWFGWGRE